MLQVPDICIISWPNHLPPRQTPNKKTIPALGISGCVNCVRKGHDCRIRRRAQSSFRVIRRTVSAAVSLFRADAHMNDYDRLQITYDLVAFEELIDVGARDIFTLTHGEAST